MLVLVEVPGWVRYGGVCELLEPVALAAATYQKMIHAAFEKSTFLMLGSCVGEFYALFISKFLCIGYDV